jgi:hypothetical protein
MSAHDDGAFKHLYRDYESDEQAKLKETEIVRGLASGAVFEDPDFPCDGASLYRNQFQPPKGSLPPAMVDWNRLNGGEVAGCASPQTFIGGQTPGDVMQGALGDCWFLSSLSVLATRPSLVKRLIVSDTNAKKYGIYTVKFSKAGVWRYVTVDDRVPCSKCGKPLYARSLDPNETWVMILEKAYAKLHGCYEALTAGFIDYGLRDLTGAATMKWKWADKKIKAKLDNNTLWSELLALKEEGSLLGCSNAIHGAEHSSASGLLSGHAYAILDMQEGHADASAEQDELNVKLIKLRNPWGQGEWKGDWSDASVLWKNYPAVKAQLGMSDVNDGTFFMAWDDFKKHFNQVFLAVDYPDEGSRVRYRGKWTPGDIKSGAGGYPAHASWPQNPMYAFEVNQTTKLVAVVSQRDVRWQTLSAAGYENGVGFVVMKLSTQSRAKKFSMKELAGMSRTYASDRCCAGMMSLEPGRYTIVPSTYDPTKTMEPFILEINTDKQVQFEQEGDEIPDLDEAAEGEEDDEDDGGGEYDPEETFPTSTAGEAEPEEPGREISHLWSQAGELATLIKGLVAENKDLDARIKALEQFSVGAK